MSEETRSSPIIAIVVALVGVAGSVAAAWVTTHTQFSNEFDDKKAEILMIKQDLVAAEERMQNRLIAEFNNKKAEYLLIKQDLMATEQRLHERVRELDNKLEALDDRLQKLDAQIALAKAIGEKLATTGGRAAWGAAQWMMGSKKKTDTEEKPAPAKEESEEASKK